MFAPNRIAVYFVAVAGLLTALAPIVTTLDVSSVAGISAGFLGVVGAVVKWLDGWQKHEGRTTPPWPVKPAQPVVAAPPAPPAA